MKLHAFEMKRPVIEDVESPRRPWASSEDAVMRWAAHFWDVDRRPANFPYVFERSCSTGGSRRAICANTSRPRSRSPMLRHEA